MTIRLHDALDAINGRARIVAGDPFVLDQQAALVRDVAEAMGVDLHDRAARQALLMGLALMAGAVEDRVDGLRTAGMWWACAREWER